MRALALIVSLLILLTLAPAAKAQSGNRDDRGHTPTELWREFPLRAGHKSPADRARRQEAGRVGRTARNGRANQSDPGVSPLVWIAVLLGATGVGLAARGARRRTGLGPGRILRGLGSGRAERRQLEAAPPAQAPAPPQTPRALIAPPAARAEPERSPEPAPRRLVAPPVKRAEPERSFDPGPPPAPPAERATPERSFDPAPPPPAPRPVGRTDTSDRSARPYGGTRFVRSTAAAQARPQVRGRRAFGYVTASDVGKQHRRDLTDQTKEIHRACRELGLSLVHIVSDIESPDQPPTERPGLASALARLAAREADCLVVTELRRLATAADDLSRLGALIDPATTRVVAIDDRFDTNAEQGWEAMGQTPTTR